MMDEMKIDLILQVTLSETMVSYARIQQSGMTIVEMSMHDKDTLISLLSTSIEEHLLAIKKKWKESNDEYRAGGRR